MDCSYNHNFAVLAVLCFVVSLARLCFVPLSQPTPRRQPQASVNAANGKAEDEFLPASRHHFLMFSRVIPHGSTREQTTEGNENLGWSFPVRIKSVPSALNETVQHIHW
jgi:hypothetical protein